MECVTTQGGFNACNATNGASSVFAERFESTVDLWAYAKFDLTGYPARKLFRCVAPQQSRKNRKVFQLPKTELFLRAATVLDESRNEFNIVHK